MQTIKMADDAIYDCAFCATDGNGYAYIALDGATFLETAAIFSDATKTARIEWGDYDLVGYTELAGIFAQPYGIQAVLRGGHDERRE